MQPIIGKIEQLTPSPPTGGSGVPDKPKEITIPLSLDLNKLDEAQQKADKLKATLLEVQELIQNTKVPADIFANIEKSVEEFLKSQNKRQEDFKRRIEQDALRVKRW